VDGLDEVEVESRLARQLLIGGEPVAGDGDQAESFAVGSGSDPPGNFISIEAGQTDIHEGRVGAQPEHEIDAGGAVLGLVYLVTVDLEEHAKGLA